MRLFIAEKPSMGREISKVLPEQQNIKRRDGYIEQGDDIVTWAFGHVLEQAEPSEYDKKFERWNANDLPIVPKEWKLLIKESSAKQFHIIKGLIEKADIIVNAGDPDREGQLLIDEILDYVQNTKPVQRILLNALDEKSIRYALDHLQDNGLFYNLKQSALARARADWLIGMNLSRAYTLAERRKGNRVTFPIGRVKTPTLALVVRRERELENFQPVDYFTVKALYEHPKGSFWATWQPKDEQKGLDPEGRLLKKEVAQELVEKLEADPQGVIAKREKSKKKESPRLPLSLSTLQVLAGKAFNYDPQTVLDTAQKLYEKKLTSYPRSDSEYLPLNQLSDATTILKNLMNCGENRLEGWSKGANPTLKSRAWNDKKVTAHHAIIPTTVRCQMHTLSTVEKNIYFLISQAYIAQFYADHEYEQTKLTVVQCDETFTASGRVVIVEGWKEIYRKQNKKGSASAQKEENLDDTDGDMLSDGQEKVKGAGNDDQIDGELPAVKKGDSVQYKDATIDKKSTKPPSRFTAATLIQAMKEIHKYVRNENLKKQLKDVAGIGTEATRATIIDELLKRNFMKETGKKKTLSPTELGYMLVDALPEELHYPDETAVWEERLALMSEGKDELDAFLTDQIAFLEGLITKANSTNPTTNYGEHMPRETIVRTRGREQGAMQETCPQCKQGRLIERTGKFGPFYGCTNYPKCKYTRDGKLRTDASNGIDQNSGINESSGLDERVIRSKRTLYNERSMTNENGGGEIDKQEQEQRYPCPRCKKGYFIKAREYGKIIWKCQREGCNTSCADVDGRPSIYLNLK